MSAAPRPPVRRVKAETPPFPWEEDPDNSRLLPPVSPSGVASATRTSRHRRQEAAPNGPGDGAPWPALAVPVAVVTLLVSFIGVGREMWIDEYVTAYVTRLSWAEFRHLLGNQDIVHGLYFVLIRLWTAVFGTSLLALRFPSMLGMAVAAAGIAVLGRRLHSAPLGVSAGLLFAALPAVSRFALEARSYAWVVALAVLSTLALTYAQERPKLSRWLLYGLLTLALTYLHFAAALVLLPHGLLAWNASRRGGTGRFGQWAAVAGAVTLAAAPLLYIASGQSGQVSWVQNGWAEVKQYPGQLFSSEPVFWAVAILGVLGAARLAQARPGLAAPLLVWALVPPVLSYVTNDLTHLFLAKYALFTLPAWALLAAAAFVPLAVDRGRELAGSQVAGAVMGLLVLSLAGLAGQQQARRSPLYGEPDFRGAAAVVDAHARAGDGVVYVGTYRWARLPFSYELHRAHPVDVFAEIPPAQNGWYSPRECADPARCVATVSRIWLVVTNFDRDDYAGLPAKQAEVLRRRYHPAGTTTLENARVLLLVRNGSTGPNGGTGG